MRSAGHPARFPIAALAAIGVLGFASAAVPPHSKAAPPRRHIVEIRGMGFDPAVLEVQQGDTVIWINRDIVPHTATATRKSGWNTGPLLQGQSGRYVPHRKGEDGYACALHPTMLGKLIIR